MPDVGPTALLPDGDMEPLTPIYTADLFAPLHSELIGLLRGLKEDDWTRPTVAGAWLVRDVAGHLLDIDLRELSGARDKHSWSSRTASSFADIVALINDDNAAGIEWARRLSPRLLVDLLEVTGAWVSAYVQKLPPHAMARIGVAWAGEDISENWMNIGREYTERWHHQMQIRAGIGTAGLLQRHWFYPVLDLSVRAFRRAYQGVPADPGSSVVFEVDAEGENVWSIIREEASWELMRGRAPRATTYVRADAETAWRLLYNALPQGSAKSRLAITGDPRLVGPLIAARSVMV